MRNVEALRPDFRKVFRVVGWRRKHFEVRFLLPLFVVGNQLPVSRGFRLRGIGPEHGLRFEREFSQVVGMGVGTERAGPACSVSWAAGSFAPKPVDAALTPLRFPDSIEIEAGMIEAVGEPFAFADAVDQVGVLFVPNRALATAEQREPTEAQHEQNRTSHRIVPPVRIRFSECDRK